LAFLKLQISQGIVATHLRWKRWLCYCT